MKRIHKFIHINTNQITIDSDLNGDKAFVIGTKVNAFHTLDKTYKVTLNVCATQELHRIIQQEQSLIDNLTIRSSFLENKLL